MAKAHRQNINIRRSTYEDDPDALQQIVVATPSFEYETIAHLCNNTFVNKS